MTRAVVVALIVLGCQRPTSTEDALMFEGFEDLAAWHATGSEGVSATLQAVPGVHGMAMQMAFDLGATSGYAVARRELPLELADDFELSFELRGDAPVNNIELKLIDASGDNVWWFHRKDYAVPTSWRHIVIKRQQIEFAWGPSADHTLRRIAAIELVVSCGRDGGKGALEVDDLAIRAGRSADVSPAPDDQASEVASDDDAANKFIAQLAHQLPRGSFPRAWVDEQPYWTVVGVDGGGGHASLLSEDGAIELASGASLEPFVEAGVGERRVTSWANGPTITQALVDDELPIPSVTWHAADWELTITALAIGEPAHSQLAVRYTLRNRSAAQQQLRMVFAVRPLQVNPATQFLNRAGGVRRIHQLQWRDGVLTLDGVPALQPLSPPDRIAAWPFHALGYPIAPLPSASAASVAVDDPAGLASGALAYDLALAPGAESTLVVVAPLTGTGIAIGTGTGMPTPSAPAAWFDAQLASARAAWHARLDRVGFRVPADGEPLIHTLRSSLAYMLLSRDGAILRPGTRAYARAWIRDGAMIGEALLRLGHPDVAAGFLRWYAPFQAASGAVPCCVERHGAIPVPEHDSHGELIHLAVEVARYTHDYAAVGALWPHIDAAAHYLDHLRSAPRPTADPAGLLPPSISHEGYSAKPAYSYWDDFWALTGYRDAAELADQLGLADAVHRLTADRAELELAILDSLAHSTAAHHIDYIPGAAELGDYDATSTTIALSPAGEQSALPSTLLTATFERAWQTLAARDTDSTWDAYTPYELRLVGAFVRLGWRDRAFAALTRYLADQRPRAWNQWAEVVGRDPRAPRFIGDMPHAWICSDYARALLDLFAYERADDHTIILAAGIPDAWFAGTGFAIRDLPTPYGALSYDVTARGDTITVHITSTPPSTPPLAPAGSYLFTTPFSPALAISHLPATITLHRPRSGDPKHL